MRTARSARLATALAVTALLTTATAPAALAQDGTTATITGGALGITLPLVADFTASSITGVAQTTTAAMDAFTASDLRGSGAGWHLTLQATPFTDGTRTLAANSLTMPAPTVSSPDTDSPDPTVTPGTYSLDAVGATKIATAAIDTGMGAYEFSASTLTLALPADVFAGAYASTVTASIVTGP